VRFADGMSVLAAHAGYLALPFRIHTRKTSFSCHGGLLVYMYQNNKIL
jgi:hypothetical protein